MLENLNSFFLISLLFAAVFFDVSEKRIPNFLTFPSILIGLVLNIIIYSLNGIMFSLYGFAVGFIIFFIPFALGLMGAGDVKLMAAIGALKGFEFAVLSMVFSAIAGIMVVLGYLIYKKKLFSYFRRYFVIIVESILKYFYFSDKNVIGNKLKRFAYSSVIENKENEKLYIPYGLAIAIGTLIELSVSFETYLLF